MKIEDSLVCCSLLANPSYHYNCSLKLDRLTNVRKCERILLYNHKILPYQWGLEYVDWISSRGVRLHKKNVLGMTQNSMVRLQYRISEKYRLSLSFLSYLLVWFYGISTIVGYLMPNPFYTCINI